MGGRNRLVIVPTSTGQIDKKSSETRLTVSVPRGNAIRRHSLAGFVIAKRITRRIRFEEGIVDSEGCLHAFGSCCNHKLHTAAGISRGIKAGDVGSGVFATLNAISILAKLTAEAFGQMRALILPRGEKQRASRKELAVGKPDSFQLVTLALKARDRRLNDPNVQSPDRFHRFAITREGAIRAEDQILAPKQQLNR